MYKVSCIFPFSTLGTNLLIVYKVSLSIRVMEEEIEKEAMEKYGSKDSGASLGAILGKALGREKKEE